MYKLDNAININNGRSKLMRTVDYDKVSVELEKLKIHDDDKIFIHVARCAKVKNQELLVKTFNRFLNEGNHGILILIGASYDSKENIHITAAKKTAKNFRYFFIPIFHLRINPL